MASPNRLISKYIYTATIVFITSLVMTLISAFVLKIPILVILFLITQTLAYLWYTLSYIPFARTIAKKWLKNCINCE